MALNVQPLGGTRQSSPLDDEMSYPLTIDEYLTIKEGLASEKLTDWESFLLTTAITSAISLVIFWLTASFETQVNRNGHIATKVNVPHVLILVIYGAITFGTLLGFFIALKFKKKTKKSIHRLDEKILKHLNVNS